MTDTTERAEALRLANELPSVENLKKIAASESPTAIQNGLVNAIKWIQSLERELKFERAASFRDQVASLEAERDKLREEVERLRKDGERLDWIESEIDDLRAVETGEDDYQWVVISHHMAKPHEREVGRGNSARNAIDRAIESAKEQQHG